MTFDDIVILCESSVFFQVFAPIPKGFKPTYIHRGNADNIQGVLRELYAEYKTPIYFVNFQGNTALFTMKDVDAHIQHTKNEYNKRKAHADEAAKIMGKTDRVMGIVKEFEQLFNDAEAFKLTLLRNDKTKPYNL